MRELIASFTPFDWTVIAISLVAILVGLASIALSMKSIRQELRMTAKDRR